MNALLKPILTLILILPSIFYSQINSLDEANGFKNFKFGTQPSDYKNLMIEIEEGNSKLYSVDNASIVIDGIQYEYIRLTFIKNKLAAVSLRTKNGNGSKCFQDLKNNFGLPKKNVKENSQEWNGSKVQLTYMSVTGNDAIADFYCKEMYPKKGTK
jgi:hypothetical protein